MTDTKKLREILQKFSSEDINYGMSIDQAIKEIQELCGNLVELPKECMPYCNILKETLKVLAIFPCDSEEAKAVATTARGAISAIQEKRFEQMYYEARKEIQELCEPMSEEEIIKILGDLKIENTEVGHRYYSSTDPDCNKTHLRLYKHFCEYLAKALVGKLSTPRLEVMSQDEVWTIIVRGLENQNLVGGSRREQVAEDIAKKLVIATPRLNREEIYDKAIDILQTGSKNKLGILAGTNLSYCATMIADAFAPRLTDWEKILPKKKELNGFLETAPLSDIWQDHASIAYNQAIDDCLSALKSMSEPRLMGECPDICSNTNCANYSKTCVIGKKPSVRGGGVRND